jgi:hypothetical protein
MLWQEETGMYFRMAGGYVTVRPPQAFRDWPILSTLYGTVADPNAEEDLKAFVGANDVRAIIVADTSSGSLPLLSFLDPNPVHVGGVTVFHVPSDILRRYANAQPPGG